MTGHTVILSNPYQRDRAVELIRRAPDGVVVTVKERKRSADQNAKMWAMLSEVSRAKPRGLVYPPEVWKALFMQALGHEIRFVPGIVDGLPFPLGFKSSRLTKAQMADLITFIDQWCAENDVRLLGERMIA